MTISFLDNGPELDDTASDQPRKLQASDLPDFSEACVEDTLGIPTGGATDLKLQLEQANKTIGSLRDTIVNLMKQREQYAAQCMALDNQVLVLKSVISDALKGKNLETKDEPKVDFTA